jgi:hypothetical protein
MKGLRRRVDGDCNRWANCHNSVVWTAFVGCNCNRKQVTCKFVILISICNWILNPCSDVSLREAATGSRQCHTRSDPTGSFTTDNRLLVATAMSSSSPAAVSIDDNLIATQDAPRRCFPPWSFVVETDDGFTKGPFREGSCSFKRHRRDRKRLYFTSFHWSSRADGVGERQVG